jgi:uncharacterized membrane protein
MSAPQGWSDEQVEQIVATLLRVGLVLSAAVVMVGGTVFLTQHGAEETHYRIFRGEPSDLRSIAGILADAAAFRGRGCIQLGVLLLMATPVVRVVFSVVAFALQRDWIYVGVTAIVLAVLAWSMLGGYG